MAKKNNSKPAPSGSAPRVDLAEIQRILEFMTEHGLEELDYERGDLHVRLKRQAASGPAAALLATPVSAARPAAADNPSPVEAAPRASVAALAPAEEGLHIVKSPIVGTFYASPSPDSPPFVKVGDAVSRGQVLCIVEAMKLMNEIEADQAGEVVRCFVENGQPVEYGQALFSLRPA